MSKPTYHIAMFSGGKDSTAMVLRLIETGAPLDEVIFCDTSMEFPAMLEHVEKVGRLIEAAGIKFTKLKAAHDFEWYMLHREKTRGKNKGKKGYSWPTSKIRWCTRHLKLEVMQRYMRALRQDHTVLQYVGLAADEQYRTERKNNQSDDVRHPLIEWGWTEADALAYCRAKGFNWSGLYDIFNRTSCWCCPLKSLEEYRKLKKHFPELWQRLKDLDEKAADTFLRDGWSVENLEKRFELEELLTEAGHSIRNKRFYTDLKRYVFEDVPVDEILKGRCDELEG